MKGKAIIPLALGLVVGLLAVKFLVDTLKKAQASGSEKQTITAVRATQDIDAFQEITRELVEQIEAADSKLIPASERIANIDDVLGRVTSKSIPMQSPVFKSMLAPEGTDAGMAGRIEEGFRAVSVKIDEASGVAYQLRPGDWVDVIVVMDIDTGSRTGRKKQTIAEVILQHVQIAAIGQNTSGPSSGTADAKVKPAKSATLIVAEEDVPKLHLAGTRGKITLAMRGQDSKITEKPPIARESELYRNFGGEEPVEAPAPVVIAAPTPQPAPVAQPVPTHNLMVYTHLPKAPGPKSEQFMFENARSRTILSLGDGPGSRAGSLFQRKNTAHDLLTRPGTTPAPQAPAPDTNRPAPSNERADYESDEDGNEFGE